MNGANRTHPVTSPASGALLRRRSARADLLGGLVRILAWMVLCAAFVFGVSMPARGARTWGAPSAIGPGAMAEARSAPPPVSR